GRGHQVGPSHLASAYRRDPFRHCHDPYLTLSHGPYLSCPWSHGPYLSCPWSYGPYPTCPWFHDSCQRPPRVRWTLVRQAYVPRALHVGFAHGRTTAAQLL